MKIVNLSKNVVIAENVQTAESYSEKAKGLIGEEKPQALFLKTRWGIHTFGMRFPIDVIVFDDKNIIQAIKENLRPNKIFFWNPKYQNVLELPSGKIADTHTKKRDELKCINKPTD